MEPTNLTIRAVVLDIYHTLLARGLPPKDASQRWEKLWRTSFASPPRLTLAEMALTTAAIVAREHKAAHAFGISSPEVFWPAVVAEALPELRDLSDDAREEFVSQHAQLLHAVNLEPGATEGLRMFLDAGVLLGLASNAQPYTVRELDEQLSTIQLERSIFTPEICCFSFELGFSKPDPHFFRFLTARLAGLGVKASETLMVGNRLDNDIEPARAQGWHTWHLTPPGAPPEEFGGDWPELISWFKRAPKPLRTAQAR